MLNVNVFVLLLCLEVNSIRVDTAETNNFIVWPNDDIRTVAMSTENYGLAVACFQVYYSITKYTKYNISYSCITVIFTGHLWFVSVYRTNAVSIRPETEYSDCVFASRYRKHAASQVSPTSRISHSLNPETLSSLSAVTTKVPQVWISFGHNAE